MFRREVLSARGDESRHRELGEELGVPVFDFASVFPASPHLYVGVAHVTEAGSRLKAKWFADYLEQSALLPDRS